MDDFCSKAHVWLRYQMAQSIENEIVTAAELLNIQNGEISHI